MHVRRKRPRVVLAIPLLLAASGCGGEPEPGELVTLTFDWPAGMTFEVEASIENTQTLNGVPQVSGGTYRYQTAVESHERGLLLRQSGFEPPEAGASGPTDAFMTELLSNVVPSTVVSTEGELLEVVGIEEMVAYVRGLVTDSIGDIDSEAFEQFIDTMLSEEALTSVAATEWTALVGFWVGGELEVGAQYEMETREPLPILPGAMVDWRYEFGIAGRVPCDSSPGAVLEGDATEPDCVELILRSYPDPDAVGEVLADFIERAMADVDAPPFRYEGLEIENETVLIARPDGLIPHELLLGQRMETTVDVGGQKQSGGGTRIRRYRYTH